MNWSFCGQMCYQGGRWNTQDEVVSKCVGFHLFPHTWELFIKGLGFDFFFLSCKKLL